MTTETITAPVHTVLTRTKVAPVVTAASDSAGQAYTWPTATSRVYISNANSTKWGLQYQMSGGAWQTLGPRQSAVLDIDISTQSLMLRRGENAPASIVIDAVVYTQPGGLQAVLDGSTLLTADQLADVPQNVFGWDDLRFPSQGINPAGAVDAPAVETTLTGYPGTLLFSGSADNVIAGVAQMPHAWRVGSDIYPHIHWSKPVGSASAVTWQLYYRILGYPGEAHGALVGPIAGTLVAGDQATSNEMLITSFGAIVMTGQRESTCLNWQLRRLGSTDADNGTARMFEFDIHFQHEKSGTPEQFPA
jgi:hypothetical protein